MAKNSNQRPLTGLEIAVIGMAGRFPQANDIDAFWNNLRDGVEAISFSTLEILAKEGVPKNLLDNPAYVPSLGGILEGKDLFDAAFFDYTPMEATIMNPQIRVFHECAWHALEDGGYDPYDYEGVVGLYAGASTNYAWTARVMLSGAASDMGQFAALLMHDKDFLCTRISYKLNLKGPAVMVHTACSTSLAAIHIACRALLMKECDMALAGGVGIRSLEDTGYIYEDGMIRSADGHCRAFDASASGTINGDGVGLALLKPLKAALSQGDHIYAVILSSALNNDGARKVGYTAPSVEGESTAIKTALHLGRVEAETVTYIETHGTGTKLGDPIEVEALRKAFNTDKKSYCAIGSVKTNVGHLDAAAGIAGFMKTVLALKYCQIPPSLNFSTPNPNIDFENSPFYVNTTLKEWINPDAPLRAGVSSFGIGGTNAHVLLEEAPSIEPSQAQKAHEFRLLVWSAKTPEALDEATALLKDYLAGLDSGRLGDAAFTMAVGRHRFNHRRMLVCSDTEEAVALLKQERSPKVFSAVSREENRPVVFMFPGQGSQYVNMGLDLYTHEPAFRQEMDHCFDILKPELQFDIKTILFPEGMAHNPEALNQTETAQLVIFMVEYALAKLLISWGIEPDHMIGHSIGEYTAACLAGVFTLEDALRIVALRGRLMQSLPGGSMLSVALPEEELLPLIDPNISLAAVNSSASCVVSGPHEAVDAFQKKLEERQVNCRRLHVSHAFHSHMMDPILDQFKNEVATLELHPPRQSFISNASGKSITNEEATNPSYWSNHIRGTVHFGKGTGELLKKKNACFVEVGPGKALSTFVRNHNHLTDYHVVVNLMRHPQEAAADHGFLVAKLGHLWLQGAAVDWTAYYREERCRRLPLPKYPFQRQRFWLGPEVLQGQLSPKPQKIKRPDVADWFYVPVWKQAINDRAGEGDNPSSVLMFADQGCLSGRLIQFLRNQEIAVISVRMDEGIDVANEDSYLSLFRRLDSENRLPSTILYLWPLGKVDRDEALDACFYGLLFIARSLGKIAGDRQFAVNVVTAGCFSVTGKEELNPFQALVSGPVRAISQEYPTIQCRLIDLDPEDQAYGSLDLELLWREWSDEDAETVSALRGRHRWIPEAQAKALGKGEGAIPTLRNGGVYLITGGLGGMGLSFARHLAATVQAKLALIGRSAFPLPADWDRYLEDHDEGDPIFKKITLIREMEAKGAQVMALQADVANAEQMIAVKTEVHRRFGPVNGVIHSAGVADGGLIQARSREMTETVLAPKVKGTLLLAELFDADEPDFLLLCSSLSSVLSIYGNVGYGAANAFMDAFSHSRNQKGMCRTVSVNWDTWQEVGMAVESLKKRNVMDIHKMLSHGILPDEGFDALTRILSRRFPQVLVSTIDLKLLLDSRHWSQAGDDKPGAMDTIEKMTKSDSMMDRPELGAPYVAPRDRLEEKLAHIWQEYFGIHQVGVHDDFFELGGDSLRGMMFVNKYKELLGEIVHVTAIFNAPTISSLADYFKEHYPTAAARIIDPSGGAAGDEASEVVTDDTIQRIRSWLPQVEFFENKSAGKNPPAVFVLAPPRSGSTLLRVILGGHPGIFSPPELGLMFFNRLADDRSDSQAAVRALMEIKRCGADEAKNLLQQMREQGLTVQEFYRYLQNAVSPQLLVDKTPGYALYPQVLKRMESDFENAYFIHLLRHPYGMISSAVEAKVDLLHGGNTLKELGVTRRQFAELMYVICHQNIEGFLEGIPGHRQYRLSYEAMVREPERYVKELCGFLHLEFHPAMLEPYGETKKRMTDGIHSQGLMVGDVKFHNYKKIEPAIADSWKKKITEDFMGDVTRELAESFGYRPCKADGAIVIEPAPQLEAYPVSSAQKRIFVLEQFEGGGTVYNMTAAHMIDGALDLEKAQQTFRTLIARHETLRTSFALRDGEPVQIVGDDAAFAIEITDAASEEEALDAIKKFARPFDLSIAPLLRVMAVKLGERRFVLAYDLHHIISDGFSNRILLEEFNRLYRGEELPPLTLQYKDFAWWEHNRLEQGAFHGQEQYWLRIFSGELPVLQIPTDFPRPEVQSFSGKRLRFCLEKDETDASRALASENNVTFFMLFLSIFYILLHKLSLQEDVIVGTPIAGRRHAEMHRVIGMFVNTLALRGRPEGRKTFLEFLAEVRALTLDAFDNQEYQFEELVEKAVVQRDMSRNPLFDTLFSLQRRDVAEGERLEDLDTGEFQYDKTTVKFDLDLVGQDNGQRVLFLLSYCDALFNEATILRFMEYFKVIISAVIANPRILLEDICVLSDEEKRVMLEDFNDTAADYPNLASVHELFARQVRQTPDWTALISEDLFVSYRELHRQSGLLAAELRSRGCGPEDVIAVLMDRTSSVAVAYLAILRCGAGYMPVSTAYPPERLAYVWNDSDARFVITDDIVNFTDSSETALDTIRLQADRPVGGGARHLTEDAAVPSQSLVYIIYTSGSTGMPKGVMVEHRGVVRLVKETDYFPFISGDRFLQTCALEFDVSTFEFWGTLLNGLTFCLAPKERIISPSSIKRLIRRLDIGSMWMTVALFNQLSQEDIDIFCGLRHIICGGDALSPYHINRLRRHYPDMVVVNGYGPTENTSFSTAHAVTREYPDNVPIGRPLANSTAYILDRRLRLCPMGVAGELCVGGDGVARGYLNRPELTAERFVANPFKYGDVLYRTGDLARYLPDGTIEFLGRLDFQVKIRGFRVELGEIENRLLDIEGIGDAVVLARDSADGEKYLCAYLAGAGHIDNQILRDQLGRFLPDYMIPAHFIFLDEIPLSASGKVDRRALPEPEMNRSGSFIPPAGEIEVKLAEIWAGVLGMDADSISVTADFFQLGGHSLKATIMAGRVHRELDIQISITDIFRSPTIRRLANVIREAKRQAYETIPPVEKKDYYPVSSAQSRLYFLQQMDKNSTVYNIPHAIRLSGDIDSQRIESVFRALVARHESFRSCFTTVNDEPVQRIHDQVECTLRLVQPEENDDERQLLRQHIRPFDLTKAPLLRVAMATPGKNEHLLLVDMHHIISDGTSLEVLNREFHQLFDQQDLEALPLQYKDFAEWQRSKDVRSGIDAQYAFWLKTFNDDIPVLALPYDCPRPEVQSFDGSLSSFRIGARDTALLRDMAHSHGATLYIVLLALFNILLAKLSGQEDIVVGTPVAGRNHADLEFIIGMFVNTLALRNSPAHDMEFFTFLAQIKAQTIQAFENQDVQFEELVELLSVTRDAGRNPIFDVMFALQNTGARPGSSDKDDSRGETGQDIAEYGSRVSRFDMTWTAIERGECLHFNVEYCSRLFKKETIRRFIGYFCGIVAAVVSNTARTLGLIEILPDDERDQILNTFNDTSTDFPHTATINNFLDAHLRRQPDKIAAAFEDEYLTYGGLLERAERLAGTLRSRGVGSGDIVAIMADPSMEMIVGLVGIVRSGAAFLPIDHSYPHSRVSFMIGDSAAKIVLCPGKLRGQLPEEATLIVMDDPNGPAAKEEISLPQCEASDPVYVIYTSGSTGQPKGVVIEHRSLVNMATWHNRAFSVTYQDRASKMAGFGFDATVLETFPYLACGAAIFIVPGVVKLDLEQLNRFFDRYCISISFMPTQLCEQYMKHYDNSNLRIVLTGGDRLREYTPRSFTLVNNYGPTEHTIICHFMEVDGTRPTFPIGPPVANSRCYVLGRYDTLQPVGVPGELCLGGVQLARGYLNRPQLTDERFVPDPFLPGETMYRTGDLARWLPDGAIEFVGRIDFQVKLRGLRIELGEIESRLLSFSEVRDVVVLALDNAAGEKYLCAYVVAGEGFDNVAIRRKLAEHLPEYMIPPYFVPLDRIPLTANGKVDRKALPEPELEIGDEYVAPIDELEEKLVEIWSDILGIDRSAISTASNFFQIGGHSLRATILVGRIRRELEVEIPLAEIFKTPTVQGLAGFVRNAARKAFLAVQPVEKKDLYPLSAAQKRLYILQGMDPGGAAYNIPLVMPLPRELDLRRLEEAFGELVRRHESLRTIFVEVSQEPFQKVLDSVEFQIERFDIQRNESGPGIESVFGVFIRPFDLARPPLFRVAVVRRQDSGCFLVLDLHHIITDGVSQSILTSEFTALYLGRELPPLKLQYKDFAAWQEKRKEDGALDKQGQYWLGVFPPEEDLPVLDLPLDFSRPAIQRFDGGTLRFALDEERSEVFERVLKDHNCTLFMGLLAVFNILLFRLTGQEDIVVGTPVAGRPHADLEAIIGMFVNTLALRNRPEGNLTVGAFLENLKERTIEAFDNQDIQFEDLVEQVASRRDAGRNPLFDAMFALQNTNSRNNGSVSTDSEEDNPAGVEQKIAKFDLTWNGVKRGGRILFRVDYALGLFKKETVERWIAYFKAIVSLVPECVDTALGQLEFLSPEEKNRLLFEFNSTNRPLPEDLTVVDSFRNICGGHGTAIVVVEEDRYITYDGLYRRAAGLAAKLKSTGLPAGGLAAVLLEASIDMVAGIWAILLCGAAYLPVDPELPSDRIEFMLRDGAVTHLLVKSEFQRRWNDVCITLDPCEQAASDPGPDPDALPGATDSAYVIYTSGSTGRPKGVVVNHRSLLNLCLWHIRRFSVTEMDRATKYAGVGFDASVWEMFPYFITGASLYIAPETIKLDVARLSDFFASRRISITFLPTQMAEQFMAHRRVTRLRILLTGGDKLRDFSPGPYLTYNNYGPTENTVVSTSYPIEEQSPNIPIGIPVDNTRAFIVDKWNNLQPTGVAGELCVAGEGLAAGYMNRPELTADRFVANPFEKGELMYRTGDLGCFLPDGNIRFLGRVDFQVKIRGFRVELGEIESKLMAHPAVEDVVVLDVMDSHREKYLAAYVVAAEGLKEERLAKELERYLAQSLPAHMIPAAFVYLERIPLTANGKVNRRALPEPQLGAGEEFQGAEDEIESALVSLWEEILGREPGTVGVTTDFFQIGGHSLRATILAGRIHRELNCEIPLGEIFRSPTIRGLASFVRERDRQVLATVHPVEKKDCYLLSSAQKRLVVMQSMAPASTAYNVSRVVGLGEDVDVKLLEEVFGKLIARHGSFRTAYITVGQTQVQRICDTAGFSLEKIDLSLEAKDSSLIDLAIRKFIRPFDLALPPLLRAGLFRLPARGPVLAVDIHHIACDGASMDILLSDFRALMAGEVLPDIELRYVDYAEWQQSGPVQERIQRQAFFWKEVLSGMLPALELPLDFPRPAVPGFDGKRMIFWTDGEMARRIVAIAAEAGATVYMGMLAVFYVFLAKISGQSDICVGTPTAGRTHPDLHALIGMFVNTLVMRNFPAGEKTFRGLLAEVRHNALQAFENQDFQFEDIVESLAIERHGGRNPIFDVMFEYSRLKGNRNVEAGDHAELQFDGDSKFDLILNVMEYDDCMALSFGYNLKLFKPGTIRRFNQYFQEILAAVTARPERKISELQLTLDFCDEDVAVPDMDFDF